MSDQESEPAAAAAAEDAPVKLEEELKRFVSQATQTVGDTTDVAGRGREGGGGHIQGESDDVKSQVQITASLSEVHYMYNMHACC